ncbi:hypothetical protein [Pseudoxanthomonas sp. Root630]|uniref:hypothetical protein n=1 Tax=Pseudoxanthomonas sp. Root630 TaxID=1736574 RepID=UPI0007037137|nr:hypothetical protein [Pseudoxanthomonas sp. Root630]KRA46703.1 hypothetical protein ASD72_05825 [Pseudoxanthomonas sp. Root630]
MRVLFLVLAAFTSMPCLAHEASSQGWQREHLGDYVSDPGEPLPVFLLRLGETLHVFTRNSGNEACGAIAHDGERYGLSLYTDGVPHGCAINTSEVPAGFTFVGETLHSHPWQKVLDMTSAARAWSHFYRDGNGTAPTLRNDGSSGFSRADLAGGPGWLVAKGQLLHQARGRTTRHGEVTGK